MKYDDKFKKEAVRLSFEIGIKEAAKKLDVPYYTLAEWQKNPDNHVEKEELKIDEEVKKMTKAELLALIEKQREEKARLIKEIREVEESNEILKDALNFFSQDLNKK